MRIKFQSNSKRRTCRHRLDTTYTSELCAITFDVFLRHMEEEKLPRGGSQSNFKTGQKHVQETNVPEMRTLHKWLLKSFVKTLKLMASPPTSALFVHTIPPQHLHAILFYQTKWGRCVSCCGWRTLMNYVLCCRTGNALKYRCVSKAAEKKHRRSGGQQEAGWSEKYIYRAFEAFQKWKATAKFCYQKNYYYSNYGTDPNKCLCLA